MESDVNAIYDQLKEMQNKGDQEVNELSSSINNIDAFYKNAMDDLRALINEKK